MGDATVMYKRENGLERCGEALSTVYIIMYSRIDQLSKENLVDDKDQGLPNLSLMTFFGDKKIM